MDDIIQRLRKLGPDLTLCDEAADLIESLQKRVDELSRTDFVPAKEMETFHEWSLREFGTFGTNGMERGWLARAARASRDTQRYQWLKSNVKEEFVSKNQTEFFIDSRMKFVLPLLLHQDCVGNTMSLDEAIDIKIRGEQDDRA